MRRPGASLKTRSKAPARTDANSSAPLRSSRGRIFPMRSARNATATPLNPRPGERDALVSSLAGGRVWVSKKVWRKPIAMLTLTAATVFKKYHRKMKIIFYDICNIIRNVDIYYSILNSKTIDKETTDADFGIKNKYYLPHLIRDVLIVHRRFKYVKFATHFDNNEYRSLWKCYQEFLNNISDNDLCYLFNGITVLNITSQIKAGIVDVIFKVTTGKSDRQEGDFVLEYLFNSTLIHRTSFSIYNGVLLGVADPRVVIVGGSQGFNARTVRREAALMSFEIAPEDLLLAIVMAFARANNFKAVFGIKSAYHSKTFAQNIQQFDPDKIKHQYDGLWERHGGQEMDCFYQMDVRDKNPISSTASGKHRRRKLKKQMHKNCIIAESERKFLGMFKEGHIV